MKYSAEWSLTEVALTEAVWQDTQWGLSGLHQSPPPSPPNTPHPCLHQAGRSLDKLRWHGRGTGTGSAEREREREREMPPKIPPESRIRTTSIRAIREGARRVEYGQVSIHKIKRQQISFPSSFISPSFSSFTEWGSGLPQRQRRAGLLPVGITGGIYITC